MCTNFVLIKSPAVLTFCEQIDLDPSQLIEGDFRPGSIISIVTNEGIQSAYWWLFLRETAEGWRPHPDYFSVNTNWQKLSKRSEYRSSRCIILATAFTESQGGKAPHLLTRADDGVMMFGGLYKTWNDKKTGELIWSASIITLPGHPAMENIHRKSTPLWLPDGRVGQWLDPKCNNTNDLNDLLEPAIRYPLTATPIDKTMKKKPVGEPYLILADY